MAAGAQAGTASGGVTFEAGAGSASLGILEVSEASLERVASVALRASQGGSGGPGSGGSESFIGAGSGRCARTTRMVREAGMRAAMG